MLTNISSHYISPTPASPSSFPCAKPLSLPSLPIPWTCPSQSYILSLLSKETDYCTDPFALCLHQPYLTPLMRAMLLDWLSQVSSEFTFNRETYYLAVHLIDRFCSIQHEIHKNRYQLIGLTALLISAKAEETTNPRLIDFAKMADNGFSPSEIREMERNMLKTLSYRIFPPTIFAWMNILMSLWDDFMSFLTISHINIDSFDCKITFKQANSQAYRLYRETFQLLDTAYFDVNALRYKNRYLAAGLLYLIASKRLYETDFRLLKCIFGEEIGSLDVIFKSEKENKWGNNGKQVIFATQFQRLFLDFLRSALEIEYIEEIYPSVAFLHGFLSFESNFELPEVCKVRDLEEIESHYEEFLAYQTHNPAQLRYVTQRISN